MKQVARLLLFATALYLLVGACSSADRGLLLGGVAPTDAGAGDGTAGVTAMGGSGALGAAGRGGAARGGLGGGGAGGAPIGPDASVVGVEGGPGPSGGTGGVAPDASVGGMSGTGGGTATACLTDADCLTSPTGPVCDTISSTCVDCLPNGGHCALGLYCSPALVCEIGCEADLDCVGAMGADDAGSGGSLDGGGLDASSADAAAGAVRCDPLSHRCVGCVSDDDCPVGSLCNPAAGTCEPGCSPSRPCPTGFDCCGAQCENLRTSAAHCGACDVPCAPSGGTGACVGGLCLFTGCQPGFDDCNGNQQDGCEADLSSDPDHCDGCGQSCAALPNAQPACSGFQCALGPCAPGFADCDGNSTNGCETSVTADEANCGACGLVCALLNANPVCLSGVCQIASCSAGFVDCDATPANGCEVNTLTSSANCGFCGNVCSIAGGSSVCVNGACELTSCSSSRADCNNDGSDGCEVATGTDADNCGSCGNVCDLPNATASCDRGACVVDQCDPGFADCDGSPTNGCEANLDTSALHCGGCGSACSTNNSTPACALGACQVQCAANYADCDLNAGNGCEVSELTNVSNCGGCGTVCQATGGTPVCAAGTCGVSGCVAPLGDCDGNPSNGCETDTSSTLTHCGGCGVQCFIANGTPGCTAGTCVIDSCSSGYDDCNGLVQDGCEALLNTPVNCGQCGQYCLLPNANATCTTGQCLIQSCQSPFADCDGNPANGCEVNLEASAGNCGACGNACDATNGSAYCAGGLCQVNCAAGFGNCNASAADGCETTLTNNPSACGACGNTCSTINGAPACLGNTCAVGACDAGFGDCDLQAANGCETSTATNVLNCGSCGRTCSSVNGSSTCSGGACQIACNGGWADCDGDALNGCESNVASSLSDCGGCGAVCDFMNAGESCSGGTCVMGACTPGYADCDGSAATGCEANLNAIANCGACGNACTNAHGATACQAGQCSPTCAVGWADCNGNQNDGCETDLRTTTDCGACGVACARANGGETCSTGVCELVSCDPGFGDCDGVDANGCETPTDTDVSNCGTCGSVCSGNNGTRSCSGGSCAITCSSGFGDCDANVANGCETSLSSDVANCGACSSACTYPAGTATCFGGACQLQSCSSGYGNCDGVASNGCETLLTTVANCGACGASCSRANAGETCATGTCLLGACDPSFENCDGNDLNGCEINIASSTANCGACGNVCGSNNGTAGCATGVCNITCNSGFADCNSDTSDGCEAALTTAAHCGACGNACTNPNGTTSCVGSTCVPACNAGYASCDGSATTGCETALQSDALHCGACGNACTNANGTTACVAGQCAPTCAAGFADCDGNLANGCEADITTAANCGACGAACTNPNGTTSCSGGSCAPSCNVGFSDCDGNPANGCETNTNGNVNSCGACGNVCPVAGGTPTCIGGVCGVSSCSAGLGDCDGDSGNGCETSLITLSNCGACGQVCDRPNAAESCTTGSCVLGACSAGFANCDGVDANGCEVSTDTSVANCGACGAVCGSTNGTASCALASCNITCDSGFGNCDGNIANGCETNVTASVTHCGGCGQTCTNPNGTASCSAGTCTPSCAAGFASCDGIGQNGCETDLGSSTASCGACGSACTNPNGTTSCSAGTCVPACAAGFADCDGNPRNGCETDLNSDPAHCGACSTVCANANGGTSCVAGACTPSCSGGYGSCDGIGANGCETNLASSVQHCGGCGQACSSANGAPSCAAGACDITCNPGYADCDASVSTGCETSLQTVANCGVCGAACTNPNGTTACSSGACSPTCSSGYANCNGDPSDGCERNVSTLTDCGGCNQACDYPNASETCNAGACTLGVCAAGYGNCDGATSNGCETNLLASTSNCGACGASCANPNGTTTCVSGSCSPTCAPGFGSCDGVTANGCETSLSTNVSHCGACGNGCSFTNAAASCVGGACTMGVCNGGYGNCDGLGSNGCEAPLNTLQNCGACGVGCSNANGTTACVAGACAPTCAAGYADCDGNPNNGCETSLRTNAHCGACGVACSLPNGASSCATGSCSLVSCNPGFGNCDGNTANGCETSTATSTSHCGACGQVCSTVNGTASCSGGTCGIGCNSGYANCDGSTSNGCETNTANNASNCGACGSACSFANASASCFAGTCQLGSCSAGYDDCDSTAANGCETSLLALANCGNCGSTCDLANASESCASGACSLTACNAGYANCDGVTSNGCEVNTQASASNCGTCGNVCSATNGTPSCSAGVCNIACNAGFANCDVNAANGCETPINTVANCGSCITSCQNGHGTTTCTSGARQPACSAGWGNCDGNANNGCETSTTSTTAHCGGCGLACTNQNGSTTCSGGTCVPTCAVGWGNCDGNARNGCETPLNTTSNCGTCGQSCTNPNGTTSCNGTSCVPSCSVGWGNCDGNGANGCETSTTASVNNCGGCGTICPATQGTPNCVNGACGFSSCNSPLGDCDGNSTCETDLSTSVTDCGSCGNMCVLANATPTCSGSSCAVQLCDAGFGNCDGNASTGCEVDLDTSASHCGGCAAACSTVNATPTCGLGACLLECAAGYADCSGGVGDGCETNTQTSTFNCGSCGNGCSNVFGTTTCSNGACVPTCDPGYADCDGDPDNGCETNLNTAVLDCGSCGNVCSNANGGTACTGGVCVPSCLSGYADCDANPANGCETSTATSATNCGACGNVCLNAHGTVACTSGVCAPVCTGTFGDCDGQPQNGCETNTSSTASHCGACFNTCSAQNATSSCNSSACAFSCNSGYANCDGASVNGCETSLNSTSNCGSCGTTCTNPNGTTSCSAGACVPTCAAGFADCNGNANDGCERDINTTSDCGACNQVCDLANASESCNAGACTLTACTAGYGNCDGLSGNGCETSTQTSTIHCGACGNACTNAHGTTACTSGACAPTCTAGWGDCDGGGENGCEANLGTSSTHCGACGNACSYPNASASCSSGTCQMGTCGPGFGDCTAAAGCETPVNTTSNCGACGSACTNAHGTTACTSGACAPTCAAGYADCNGDPSDGCETSLRTLSDCGTCGTVCSRANATATCSTGVCQVFSCNAGYASCDGADANGCEINLNTNKSHCGGCGSACSTTNGTASCSAGACGISCSSGFGNCDASVTNGCETNLSTSTGNCSACGNACSYSNAGASCFAGSCQLGSCNAGYANCDGVSSNGCETSLTSLTNCGTCGAACDLANASESCASGSCTLTTCNSGFQNCDGVTSNGCEVNTTTSVANCGACGSVCSTTNGTPSCSSSACGITCSSGFGNCNASVSDGCEASLSTTSNCGSCGNQCTNANGSTSCTSGTCTPTCSAGFGNCDGNASNGCEQNVLTGSVTHCGGCGLSCTNANGTTSCSGGVCQPVCNSGFLDCDGNPRNGCETDARTTSNCGACGTTCTNAHGTASCSTGACQISCAAGYSSCDGNSYNGCETNVGSDLSNCGSCGNVCPSVGGTPSCIGGVCEITSCSAGLGNCDGLSSNGCETNLNTDLANCGACGSVCNLANASETCSGGACVIVSCTSGYASCDGSEPNGCEVNTDTSVTNCGSCGNACSSSNGTRSCSLGACSITCNASYGNCDGSIANGCETNTLASTTHCGSCGNACTNANGSTSCASGACNPTCNANFASCDGSLSNGCEANLLTNSSHCGGCGQACSNAHGTASCSGGVCTPTCSAGWADCDGNPQNGCETNLLVSLGNCGACGNTCSNANGTTSCVSGSCTPVCAGSFADCNGDSDDGCETNTNTSLSSCGTCGAACGGANATGSCALGACALTCSSGYENCNGTIADGCETSLSTTSNCGACGNACTNAHGGTACTGGVCSPTCGAGYGSCNGDPDDGCETSLTTLSNCGGCAVTCDLANASESCSSGSCSLTGCAGGWGNCDANAANGCETSLSTTSNCGACGIACTNANGSTSCNGASCVPVCSGTYGNCDGNAANGCETNAATSASHCGACGNACSSQNGVAACSDSNCSIACSPNYGNCDGNVGNGCEVYLATSILNCGTCGSACTNANGTTSCSNGTCLPVCNSGYLSCDGNARNGCETNTNASVSNCGGCGVACQTANATSTSCAGGVCQPLCSSGWSDCDGDPQNGCETNTDADPNNCGECSNACAVGSCSLGACDFAFPYVPSNFDPADPGLNPFAASSLIVLNCGISRFDSTTLAFTNWCGVAVPTPVVRGQPGGPDVVVLPMQDFAVAAGSTLELVGNRPVILAVYGDATIDGTVSAAAVGATPGAGGGVSCSGGQGIAGMEDTTSNDGDGGGGGGAFGSPGAPGGAGDVGGSGGPGGTPEGSATLAPLRGGCSGGQGGSPGGNGGGGGGAVQIAASGTLNISGLVSAPGGGGGRGNVSEDGGGGGGSGGGILLEGDLIAISGWVTTNGGGGGEGSDTGSAVGQSGSNGYTSSHSAAPGGAGGEPYGGDGGSGAGLGVAATNGYGATGGLFNDGAGGGGGGGGLGRIRINAGSSCNLAGRLGDERSVNCPKCPNCAPEADCVQAANGASQYWICPSGRPWTVARDFCTDLGYELATISDATENSFVTSQISSVHFIGFNDRTTEGIFVWDDGAPISYTNWNSGEPNNNAGGEDCAELSATGAWNDAVCSLPKGYICEGSTHCGNGIQDFDETDVDCGGLDCTPCALGGGCASGADCASGRCDNPPGTCGSCSDGVRNGAETGVDCGGGCPVVCGSNGLPCSQPSDCLSNFCVDGVCCNTACGNGASDCQVCSVAGGGPADGTCSFLSPATVCRASAGVCDVAETCSGSSATCPSNAFQPSTTVCRGQTGICDVAETCTGSSAACPSNGYAPLETDCAYSPVFTAYASGTPNANQADFASGIASRTLTGGVTGPKGWTNVLRYAVTTAGTAGNLHDYWRFSNATYVVQAGDYVEYDVSVAQSGPGVGGIDIADNSGGSYWRELGGTWADQNSIEGHPDGDVALYAYGQWYHRRLPVPAVRVGATITRWDVVMENDTPSTSFTSYYDNIVVTRARGGCDGAGVCKLQSGESCSGSSQCATGVCGGSFCVNAPPYCLSGVLDGDESDVDCGGACAPCPDAAFCNFDADCASNRCSGGVCTSCSDGVQNHDESDVDCGGSSCAPCPDSGSCNVSADCASSNCTGGTCISCADGIQNGSETDVDCGGAQCGACGAGQMCNVDGDCTSTCVGGFCEAAFAYPVSNFDPTNPALDPTATSLTTTFSCGMTTFDSAALAWTNPCAGFLAPTAVVVPQPGGPDAVVLPFRNVTVAAGSSLRLVGDRPVIIASYGDVVISGTVTASASSSAPGAGGNLLCGSGAGGPGGIGTAGFLSSYAGGGGGGGGCFAGAAAKGGYADGSAGAAGGVEGESALVPLRGGCPGGPGGRGEGGISGGVGGGGGGALQISAVGTLTVNGTVTAGGGAGTRGGGTEDGGGGGGSGGGILLEGDGVSMASGAWVTANGGGGAEGNSTGSADGSNGTGGLPSSQSPALGGSGHAGGDGGRGQANLGAATAGGNDLNDGAGGGGGSIGRIRINSYSCSLAGSTSGSLVTVCAPHCFSSTQDGDETDLDCGGVSCAGCSDGLSCNVGPDCLNDRCTAGICTSCVDAIKNADESDVDCGGATCSRCANGKLCGAPSDCLSNRCNGGVCTSCSDGIKNGGETSTDCGGSSVGSGCSGCSTGKTCNVNSDCSGSRCEGGQCRSCSDGAQTGSETGVDCGGPCAACP